MVFLLVQSFGRYAPFRDAVDSTFKGDRKRYQHPVGSSSIAMRALDRDLTEGSIIRSSSDRRVVVMIMMIRC